MLRLNQFLIRNKFNRLSNVLTKSSYYYSSEPPDKCSPFPTTPSLARHPAALDVDNSDAFLRTTNPEMLLFGPHDSRAPLNGNIGISFQDNYHIERQFLEQIRQINTFNSKIATLKARDIDIDLFLSNSYKSRCHKFFRILKYQEYLPQKMVSVTESADGCDCSAHELTVQLIKKFALLFPKVKRHELSEGLTALTFSRRTANDMSAYSEAVELERQDFFEKFVTNAKNVCEELQKSGFWADFIDPYSGQPFLSEHTNETLFETDDRFIHLGFKIEDLGCCKAIYHPKWATHVIVGTIFTTASANSPALKKLMTDLIHK